MRSLLSKCAILGGLIAGLLVMAPTPPASAAVPTGPTAIAVASNGITYVGFANSPTLTRVDASGAILAPLALPRAGAVDGLAVDASDNIWVSYGYGASKISPTGTELTYFAYSGAPASCPSDDATNPALYGGIAVSSTTVYVAQRCQNVVQRYTLTGTLQGAINTIGKPGRITYAPAQPGANQGPKIWFSTPDSAKVYEYPEAWATNGGQPLFVLDVPKGGSNTPVPTGLVVDKFGQLAVVDTANSYLYIFDTNNKNGPNSYSWYRTLGRPGGGAGDLNAPAAVAQYPVDGALQDRRGDYFVADTGNSRIQRWNSYGYTYWVASTNGGGSTPTAPVNTSLPTVTGTPAVGQTLTCTNGSWSGSPTSYSYGWNRNGNSIAGQTTNTYTVQSGDAGQNISCFVRATNAAGTSDFATSANVTIAAGPSAPANTAPPVISGTTSQGSTLTCSNGTWSGSPTGYTRVWQRNGSNIGGATGTTYVVTAADVGQAITCRVTATNSAGSSSATSAAVTPTVATTCSGTYGVSINNGAPYTTSEAVTLKIVPPAGATAVTISNDGGFAGATSRALVGNCSYAWTLALTGSARDTKVVYVRFTGGTRDGQQFSDDIVLDKTAPAFRTTKLVKKSATKVTVKVTASDRQSGLKRMEFAARKSGKVTHARAYRASFTVGKGQRASYRWVRLYDRAGNVSGWRKLAG